MSLYGLGLNPEFDIDSHIEDRIIEYEDCGHNWMLERIRNTNRLIKEKGE